MKDLHIHSIYSDGELTVEEIIKKVKENKVDFFSITDHDTLLGNKEIIEKNLHQKHGLKFVTGVELSAKVDKGKCHILGYNIDIYNEYLNKKILELNDMNKYNLNLVINYLIAHFSISLSDEQISRIFNKIGSVNNVQLAKILVELGYTLNSKEAFSKYIQIAKDAVRIEKQEFSPYECINIIKRAGGIPVLAHNYQLKKDYMELKEYLIDLKQHGLMGLECYHSGFKKSGITNSLNLACKLNLLVSGGSDYHGINVKPNIDIGTGKHGNLNINELSIEKYLTKKLRY